MLKRLVLVAVFALVVGVTPLTFLGGSASANGNGSPTACKDNPNQNPDAAFVLGGEEGTDDLVVVDVGAGNVVEGVCIKSGSNMFNGNQHSQVLTVNGLYENGCYQVAGIGTQVATVTRLLSGSTCQGISHIDVLFGEAQDDPEEPEDPETPPVGRGAGDPTTPVTPATPQVDAPVAGVNAGSGAVVGAGLALAGSLGSLGYGVARLRKTRV